MNNDRRLASAWTCGLLLSLVLTSAPAAFGQSSTCESGTTSGTAALALLTTQPVQTGKKVDEWDGDILRIQTSQTGYLTLAGLGPGSTVNLYALATGSSDLVASARVGTEFRTLAVPVKSGDYCIQVIPGTEAAGDFTLEVALQSTPE